MNPGPYSGMPKTRVCRCPRNYLAGLEGSDGLTAAAAVVTLGFSTSTEVVILETTGLATRAPAFRAIPVTFITVLPNQRPASLPRTPPTTAPTTVPITGTGMATVPTSAPVTKPATVPTTLPVSPDLATVSAVTISISPARPVSSSCHFQTTRATKSSKTPETEQLSTCVGPVRTNSASDHL